MFCSLTDRLRWAQMLPLLMHSHVRVCGVYARVKGWQYEEQQRRHPWEIHGVKSAPV